MKDCKLVFDKSIERWDEAVPLGNGRTGCLIWGNGEEVRFSLDRTDIWDTRKPLNTDSKDYSYKTLIEKAKNGDADWIRRFFDKSYNNPFPTKLPAGKILINFREGGNVQSELRLMNAEAILNVQLQEEMVQIRSICHATEMTGMIQISVKSTEYAVRLIHPEFGKKEDEKEYAFNPDKREISPFSLKNLYYEEAVSHTEVKDNVTLQWFVQEVPDDFYYGILMACKEEPGRVEVFYKILTSGDGKDWLEEGKEKLLSQIKKGYETLLISHEMWWKDYWEQSGISIPDSFMEKQWYLTNYLFASCSRKGCCPMPLQGVWTADDGQLPPWKGDYHHDLNTQLSYTHFYKANHLSEGECFIDFLWELRGAAKDFAKWFYGTEGICMPGVTTIDGQPLGGWPMYSLSPTQQIWLCQSFDLYYRYTGDEEFLRKKAWVYFSETAECIAELLERKDDGKYYLPVSSSPEIHDDEAEAWLTPNSNYDLALLRYLYETLVKYSRILENGEEKRWEAVLEHLPGFAVNENNVLMLAPDESLGESHRHLSNAMGICPLRLIQYQTEAERKIIDATILDYERLGTGMWVGFSFAWMSHLYLIQKNGEGAREQLRIFWESFCSPNGFHLNGDFKKRGYSTFHYRPFTLESNMYAADALQEMLMGMCEGTIELFPAVPDDWRKQEIAFRNFRGEGGILVSAKMCRGALCSFTIYAPSEQEIKWRKENGEIADIKIKAGELLTVL